MQCGFCIPGIIMSAVAMLNTGKTYTRDEIRKELSGHLCRCTGYENIVNAVEKAVDAVHNVAGPQNSARPGRQDSGTPAERDGSSVIGLTASSR